MRVRHFLAACLCLATALPASAQSLRRDQGPVNFPPASFSGTQFVDNRGCVYIRAGFAGAVTWVPRVGRDRRVLCGQTPTFGAGAPATAAPAPAPRAPAPRRTAPPKQTIASAMDSRPAQTQGAGGAPAWLRQTPSPAGPPTVIPGPGETTMAAPSVAAPRGAPVVRARTAPPTEQVVVLVPPTSVPTVTVAAPRPQAAPVVAEILPRASACPERTGVSAAHTNRVNVRCGPQVEDPVSGANSYRPAPAAKPVKPRRNAAVLRIEGGVAPVPKGYRPVFTDGRHNPNRGLPGGAASLQDGRWVGQGTAAAALPYVQAGTFGVAGNAAAAAARLRALGLPVTTQTVRRGGRTLTVVLAGPVADSASAVQRVRAAGFRDAFARR